MPNEMMLLITGLFMILFSLALAAYRNERQAAKRLEMIEILNDADGGDWYYDDKAGIYRDGLTDRVVWGSK